MSLRAKLTLWFGLVMAISLAVFGTLNYRSISNQLTTGLDVALNKAVQGLDSKIREVAVEAKRPRKQVKSRKKGDTSQPEVDYFIGQDTKDPHTPPPFNSIAPLREGESGDEESGSVKIDR